MPDTTPILQLPLILPAQAQKHVTHNEALRLLDVMVQLSVLTRSLTVPPATPSVGDRHIVPVGATSLWAGQAGRIALYAATGWEFIVPLAGWSAQVMTEGQAAVFDGAVWKAPSDGSVAVARLGISTAADATNRLAVASPATLLTHAGAGHQVKVNKAAAADTASLLFQTGFSGRAEMGTAGSDDFAVKVSADGTAFYTALLTAGATGEVTLPAPLHLGGQASDPVSPPDGTLWLNTTTGEVKLRSNGATLVAGGGSGVTDGDKGDVIVGGSGAVWTIDAGVVTLSKMADLGTSTILGRTTAGAGVPEALTAAQVRSLLNVANGATANSADVTLLARGNHTGTQPVSTITGLAAIATSGSAGDLSAGTLPAARFDDTAHGNRAGGPLHPNATTSVAGFLSGADKTKLDGIEAGAQVNVATDLTYTAASRLLASSTGADVTLPLVSSSDAGLVPASGGGTTNFLRADGTWAAPAGGSGTGDVVGPGSATDNALARFDATTGKLIKNSVMVLDNAGQVTLPGLTGDPVSPASGNASLFFKGFANRQFMGVDPAEGAPWYTQRHLAFGHVGYVLPQPGAAVTSAVGCALTTVGTATAAGISNSGRYTRRSRIDYLVTTAATTAIAVARHSAAYVSVGGSVAGEGGFLAVMEWGPATGGTVATNRAFCGLHTNSAPTDVQPSTLVDCVGMGWDSADANIQMMHNDGTGTATKIDLGASFPVPSVDRTNLYRLYLFAPPGTTQRVDYLVVNTITGASASGSIATNLPTTTTLLAQKIWMSVGGTSSVVGITLVSMYFERDE